MPVFLISSYQMMRWRGEKSKVPKRGVGVGPIVTYAGHHFQCSLRTLAVLAAENHPEGIVSAFIFNILL